MILLQHILVLILFLSGIIIMDIRLYFIRIKLR